MPEHAPCLQLAASSPRRVPVARLCPSWILGALLYAGLTSSAAAQTAAPPPRLAIPVELSAPDERQPVAPPSASPSPPSWGQCGCEFHWREYSRPVTPVVAELFRAASAGDEATFERLIATVPDIAEYAVDGKPLVAALLHPVVPRDAGKTRDRIGADAAALDAQAVRAKYAQLLPARTRMLALALKHGASATDFSRSSEQPPLHLAMMFGTPEMVRILLQHGADPNQLDGVQRRTAIEFALDPDRLFHTGDLPLLVDASARTEMLRELLAAGARRPYERLDEIGKRDGSLASERPAADYLLWPALAELTVGADIMEAFARLGTSPAFEGRDDGSLPPLAHAARARNLGGLRWLKSHSERIVKDKRWPSDVRTTDTWLSAAVWALYPSSNISEASATLDEVLAELIVPDMDWQQQVNLRNDSRNPLLSGTPSDGPRAGSTLLHHLVAKDNDAWIRKIVQMGAPLTGGLTEAVEAERLAAVETLLALAADPFAPDGDEKSALNTLLAPNWIRDGGEGQVSRGKTSADVKAAILAAMLATLTPERRIALKEASPDLISRSLNRNHASIPRLIRALLVGGGSAEGLGRRDLELALRSADPALVVDLLDHGAKIDERMVADDSRAASSLLVAAMWVNRTDLLPRLLAAGANPNFRNSKASSPVEWAIRRGDMAVLDLLVEHGGRIEHPSAQTPDAVTPLDLALASGSAEMVRHIGTVSGRDLTQACLAKPEHLRAAVLGSGDEFWDMLVTQGFTRTAGGSARCGDRASRAERLVLALLDHPDPLRVGWLGERLVTRLKDLWEPAITSGELSAARAQALLAEAEARERADLASALARVGVRKLRSAPRNARAPVAKQSAADKTLQESLVGYYRLGHVRELASEIELKANGRFAYAMIYGALDQYAEGTWTVRGGQILFRTPKPEPKANWQPFKLVVLPDPPAKPDPESISVGVVFAKRPVAGVAVNIIGCEAPKLLTGRTGDDGWFVGPLIAPVCQVVLRHPQINGGRSHVYAVSNSADAAASREFVFEPQPAEHLAFSDFNVEMTVADGELLWERAGRTLHYARR